MKHLTRYIHFLRRQSKHVQRIHSFIFASVITGLIAAFILYTDYGFWHERYARDLDVSTDINTVEPVPESPSQMISRFFNEAGRQFNTIRTTGSSLIEGKETFSR